MPFLPLGRRVAGPYLFLLALGGVMALAEFWLGCQLPATTGDEADAGHHG